MRYAKKRACDVMVALSAPVSTGVPKCERPNHDVRRRVIWLSVSNPVTADAHSCNSHVWRVGGGIAAQLLSHLFAAPFMALGRMRLLRPQG